MFKSLINVDKRPSDKEFTVVYAVISDSVGDELYLPFFSRVNINNAVKTLTGFGYNVELLKIKVSSNFAKTRIAPPGKQKKL